MTKFEQLVSDSQFTVAIFGNSAMDSFDIRDIQPGSGERLESLTSREGFIGLAGLVDGAPRVALAVPLSDSDTSLLACAVVQRVAAEVTRRLSPKGGGVEYLERSYLLLDLREN